jgi:hypothetical protein
MKRERLLNLITLFSPQATSDYTTRVPQILVTTILGGTHFTPNNKSKTIMASYARAQELIAGVDGGYEYDREELCEICTLEIPFESVVEAKCEAHHTFGK